MLETSQTPEVENRWLDNHRETDNSNRSRLYDSPMYIHIYIYIHTSSLYPIVSWNALAAARNVALAEIATAESCLGVVLLGDFIFRRRTYGATQHPENLAEFATSSGLADAARLQIEADMKDMIAWNFAKIGTPKLIKSTSFNVFFSVYRCITGWKMIS